MAITDPQADPARVPTHPALRADPGARSNGRRAGFAKVIGRVRFFDRDKGHGFVYFPDGSGDAYVNAEVLGPHGRTALLPETTVAGRIEDGADGRRRLHSIWAIDESTAPSSALAHREVTLAAPAAAEPCTTSVMRAKLFDPIRGWGFFARDSGADVFVHVTAIRAAALQEIVVGELYEVDVGVNTKGPFAKSLRRLEGEVA